MAEKEWIEIGPVIGDTGPKGDTGDIGIGTIIKGHYNSYSEFIAVHPSGSLGDAYIVDGSYYYWNENGWANAGSVKGDTGETGAKGDKGDKGDTGAKGSKGDKGETGNTGEKGEQGPKGDTGDTGATGDTGPAGAKGDTGATGAGVTIKGSYNSYEELINEHPTGNEGDSYLVNGFLYVWDGTVWENVGNIKGEKGDKGETGSQGVKGDTGDTGASGFSPIVNVDHSTGQIVITTEDGSTTISFDELKGDTGPQGVKGDTGNTGEAFTFDDFTPEQLASLKGATGDTGPAGPKGDTGDKGETGETGSKGNTGETGATGEKGEQGPKGDTGDTGATGDTGPAGAKGDTGATGIGTTIKGSYNTYQELINAHPTGNASDSYLVDGSLYVWNGNIWENVGNLKGDTGSTGPKGDTGDSGVKGDTGSTGPKGDTGDTGATGATGQGSDEEAGWKLPVDQILTTTTLPTGVSAGYRVAIVTSSVMAIKEYNGSSWDTESLDPYSVIPLKHSGSIQMYLAKSTGPVYMGVEYGVFGKFRFMTQAAYDALSSYDNDTIYFVRSS